MNQELGQSFFERPTKQVARELIGKVLQRRLGPEVLSCRIVEAEAYLPKSDDACHASKKRTPKNEVMFGPAGLIYVYAIHAKHCLNFVTESEGLGCAVLVRAAQPLQGLDRMQDNRGRSNERELLNGPGKLCQALEIDKSSNGQSLGEPDGLSILDDGLFVPKQSIRATERIGVTSAQNKRLRFVLRGSDYASGPKRLR